MNGGVEETSRAEELISCLGALGRRFTLGRRRFRRRRPFLTRQERHIVEAVGSRRLWRVGELAGYLEIGGSTLTNLLDRLEEKRMVERSRAEEDRRVVLVKLTPRGRRRYNRFRVRKFQYARVLLACLTEKEQITFLGLLRKMADAHGMNGGTKEKE